MSVRLAGSPVPTANSGRKVVPALDRPSYSPTKYPNGPRANGSCSTSKEASVSRSSLPQAAAWAQVVAPEGWQCTIQWSVGTPAAGSWPTTVPPSWPATAGRASPSDGLPENEQTAPGSLLHRGRSPAQRENKTA